MGGGGARSRPPDARRLCARGHRLSRIARTTTDRPLCARYLPTNTRLQLDGVNTNWGKTTLAHITNLVKLGVLGKTVVARNPVGNTHEACWCAARPVARLTPSTRDATN